MAGSLIKIDEEIVTSAVASVTLTGIDSTYDVYMVKLNNIASAGDNKDLYLNYIKASDSSVDTTANYDFASKGLYSASTFQNNSQTNANNQKVMYARGNATNEISNCIIYLFNTFNSSEYSFNTVEANGLNLSAQLYGEQGGGVHTVAQSNEGVSFSWESAGNFTSGTFTLYGLAK